MFDFFNAGESRRDDFASLLVKAALGLKIVGADAIVLCVNTDHMFAENIEGATGLPFLRIADITGQAAVKQALNKAALLGTTPAMEQAFIQGRLALDYGLGCVLPSMLYPVATHDLIFSNLSRKVVTEQAKTLFIDVVADMVKEGIQGVILARTELALRGFPNACIGDILDPTFTSAGPHGLP